MSLPPTPVQIFDRIEAAQAAWTRGGVTVDVSSATGQGVSRAEYRLDLDGAGGATLRIRRPDQGRLAGIDQGYQIGGSHLLGVDFAAREVIHRPAPDRGPIGLRFYAVLGELDDAVGFVSAKPVRDRYLVPFRQLKGWKVIPGGLVRQTTTAGKASLTRLDLDRTGRLKALHIEFPGSRLDWRFAYRAFVPMSLPRALRPVESFTVRPSPRYADATARRVVESMQRAAAGLANAIVRLDDGAATLWVGGRQVRYESGTTGFAYDGRVLTVSTAGVAYRGRTARNAVIDHVAATLGNVDPLVRSVLVRAIPFADLFPPEARVKVKGTIAVEGVPCDVVSVEAPRFRASLFVRRSDWLPASIETSALDGRGHEVANSRRTLAWSSVGTPLPASLFALRLRPGQPVSPLPKR